MLINIIVLIHCVLTLVDTYLTSFPENTEVIIGKRVTINCSTTEIYSVNWEHIPIGRTSKNYVYLGGTVIVPYNDRFHVEKSNGVFNLIIQSAEHNDGGLYRCIDREGQGEMREAQLTIIMPNSHCTSDGIITKNNCRKKKTISNITCDVYYHGNLIPSIAS